MDEPRRNGDHPSLRARPEPKVRAFYDYAWVAKHQGRSLSWVKNKITAGEIEGKAGRIPLREVLRISEMDIDTFAVLYGEDDPTTEAAS